MAERPILMSAPMVRAILSGAKIQTRRVIKPQPSEHHWQSLPGHRLEVSEPFQATDGRMHVRFSHSIPQNRLWDRAGSANCPYGSPGGKLWVRETWAHGIHAMAAARDEDGPWVYAADGERAKQGRLGDRWRPSIFMPRAASRITLEVVGIRVERLQDILCGDAEAEGIVEQPGGGWGLADSTHYHFTDPRASYWSLWEAINGPGSVEANPWVWVVEFRRHA